MSLNLKLLEKVCTTPGTPGREHRIRKLVLDEVKGLVDHVDVDPLGSVIAVRKANPKSSGKSTRKKSAGKSGTGSGGKPTRVMLAAHMDQIGFLVAGVSDKGFLSLNPTGGFDTRNLFARMVNIAPDLEDPRKDLVGVLNPGGKPVHISSPEDRKKVPEISEFFVDLGLSAEEVNKKVKIGDMVTLRGEFHEVGNLVTTQAHDNRVQVFNLIETLRKLSGVNLDCEVHAVFTVQEEVGLRGAMTSAYTVRPDIGIGMDTTLCCDTPGVPSEMKVTESGKGAALTMMDGASIGNLDIILGFEAAAARKKIPTQRSILSRGGTDSGAIQRAAGGCPTMTLSCPTRYIHTVTESCHKQDIEACRDVLVEWLKSVK